MVPGGPLSGESQYEAALHSDHLRREKFRTQKERRSEAATTSTGNDGNDDNDAATMPMTTTMAKQTTSESDNSWKNIHDSLTLARMEIVKAAQLLEVVRQKQVVADAVAMPSASREHVETQQRIATYSKADALQRAASKMYARITGLGEQLAADRVFFAQVEAVARRWRLELPAVSAALLFDYAPMFTANCDAYADSERAVCVRTRDGELCLRLPPMRWLTINHVIGVYLGTKRICVIEGPVKSVSPTSASVSFGADYCDALLQRAYKSVWIERIFMQVKHTQQHTQMTHVTVCIFEFLIARTMSCF